MQKKKCHRCVLVPVRQCLIIVFPHFLTGGNQNASTSQIQKLSGEAAQTSSLGSNSSLAASYTFTPLLDLYKRAKGWLKGWRARLTVAVAATSLHFALLRLEKIKSTFCPEDISFETVMIPRQHRDTFYHCDPAKLKISLRPYEKKTLFSR